MKNFNEFNGTVFLPKDENGREISYYNFNNLLVVGETLFYPNLLFYNLDNKTIINPIIENTMSLSNNETKNITIKPIDLMCNNIDNNSYFFFCYNTDNYYHFIYDTLPYLITYKHLKNKNNKLKLLMTYPNENMSKFYDFVNDCLKIFSINEDDIEIIKKNTLYNNITISTSYTHDFDSNLPPRKEVYELFNTVKKLYKHSNNNTPDKIYISRRSWKHGNYSNIGTNYTNRRKLINEDELVDLLEKNGYIEIFTENMTMKEKIIMFLNVKSVVGCFGGGICNVLFSNKETELIAIDSPLFTTINKRFIYSLNQVNLSIFNNTHHYEGSEFKTNMRVKFDNYIGEITEVDNFNKKITIIYSDRKLSGWNSDTEYKKITLNFNECQKIDEGLNSPWFIDIEKFKQKYNLK